MNVKGLPRNVLRPLVLFSFAIPLTSSYSESLSAGKVSHAKLAKPAKKTRKINTSVATLLRVPFGLRSLWPLSSDQYCTNLLLLVLFFDLSHYEGKQI